MRACRMPVFLYSAGPGARLSGASVDEELIVACVRAGGARGVIRSALVGSDPATIERYRQALDAEIQRIATRLRREKVARELAAKNQVIAFDTAPVLGEEGSHLQIRCRNFRLIQAVRSADTGALVSDMERPLARFAEVIGAEGAKESLAFIRDWLHDPKKYAAAGVEPPRGILLTGAPGTGKTLFARARRYAPSILFIDEIDAIGGNRAEVKAGHVGHAEALALNQLLIEMDGFGKPTDRPVIVLAATNRVETLDPALLRRFSRTIEVELPTRSERETYLHRRLAAKARHEVSDAMIERLAAQGQGMSVADYERILAQAAVMALTNDGVLTDALLAEAFEQVTLGEARAATDGLRTARHEAGHALIMCATGSPPIYVTIVGRGNFGGYAAFEDKEERRSHTRRDLEDRICQLLGGREAERCHAAVHHTLETQSQRASRILADHRDGLKCYGLAGGTRITKLNTAMGTLMYMPPEQVRNTATVKEPADLYAVGNMLYYLLTGRYSLDFPTPADIREIRRQKPEEWRTPEDALRMIMKIERIQHPFKIILNEEPIPIRQRDASIPERLAAVVDRAVKKDPDQRFQTAAAFRDALLGAV
ncbi:AAA family ATPase [Accumulibacter sp.]|uniref:AAA family ATPase n=1 Tax=Accumulibacter sp. TaxID=2053492 RepID=UPI0025864DED|nr:AAA family ATPase [Accumulibacter sp.]